MQPGGRTLGPILKSIVLTVAVSAAGGLAYLATFSRVGTVSYSPALAAIGVTLFGCVPPLWFSATLSNGAARQLSIVGWRLAILLPAIGLTKFWEGAERNCFVSALLTCYFVALPLESWLLIRDLRQPK